MHILLISHSQKSGGAERCLLEAAIGLKKRGYAVTVFIPAEGEINALFIDAGIDIKIKVIAYPWWVHDGNFRLNIIDRLKRFLSLLKYAFRIEKVIKEIKPDVILSNTICIPCGALAAYRLNIRHLWFIHEFGKEDHNLLFDYGFYISSLIIQHTSGRVLVNSELVKEKFVKHIKSDKFSVVNYNIPAPLISSQLTFSSRTFDLLIIGQIKRSKGQMEALLALEILLKEHYDVRLLVIGQVIDDEYYSEMHQYAQSSGLAGRVVFISHVTNPYTEIKRFSIGLMCSAFEALGRVTVEYMKSGIPVVGADAGSTSRLLDHNRNGLLYEKGNHLQLSQRIKELVNDKQLVEKLTSSAREFAEATFSEARFIDGITASLN